MMGSADLAWNEMTDHGGAIRPHWREFSQRFQHWSGVERGALAASASRMIADLGTTFNVYSDVGGSGQPFELDPIPLLISPLEWAHVSAGLKQRTRLLDAVLSDLYGPQEILKAGLVPPDLVHASPAFLQYARGLQPHGGRFLITTGCDLIRSPRGYWNVLRDHTSAPGGLGQVLENRNVTSSLLSSQFESLGVAPLAPFFDLERSTLEGLQPARGEMPNVVFLTPGFRHPSYFEHAYKARLLGFPLVEPGDLTVREHRLFLKTLAGLRRVDVVANRIDESLLDPLVNGGRGSAGVAGLIEAWRTGNVSLANSAGSGFASTMALMPFLPGIARKWFGEEMKLPFVETWWLGQEEVRHRVLDQMHRFVLISAFGRDELLPLRCANFSSSSRKHWMNAIAERPYDFVVQFDMTPSTCPSLEPRGIREKPLIWRAFVMGAESGPVAMPGGLVKVGKFGQPPQLWPRHAGFTKDVWIPDGDGVLAATSPPPAVPRRKARHSTALEVPSRIAEQLFWVGRYSERIELSTRLLRVTLRNLGGEAGRVQQQKLAACLLLVRGCGLLPMELIVHPSQALKTLAVLIHDQAKRGGIPSLTRSLLLNAAAARDRLSDDTWRFFNRLEDVVYTPEASLNVTELLRTLDTLVLHLAAFSGMQAENMTRGHGWRFLETGRRVERAIGALSVLKTAAQQDTAGPILLDPLLETCDSTMTYRRRHFSRPELEPVMDLVFFDATNPRSVAYQIAILHRESFYFPGNSESGLLSKIRGVSLALSERFQDPTLPDVAEFDELLDRVESFSDMLTQHYFSHSVRRVY